MTTQKVITSTLGSAASARAAALAFQYSESAAASAAEAALASRLQIGTVATGVPNTSAAASITGLPPNQLLNLTIPAGLPGGGLITSAMYGGDINAAVTAAASSGLPYFSTGAEAIAVTVPGHFANVTTAVNTIRNWSIADGSTLTLTISGKHSITGVLNYGGAYSKNILVRGETPVTTTITSVANVTGSVGNYSVTYNVASSSGIAVGDMLTVRDVKPGIAKPGTLAGRPPQGEFRLGYFASGSSDITSSGSTVNFVLGGVNVGSQIQPGDIIVARGEVRQVATVGTSTMTVNAAFAKNISPSLQYWYHMRSNAGTVECTGTTVTGTGTAFLSQANVGSIIYFVGYGIRRITAIAGDGTATVHKAITVPSGAAYGIQILGELHDGAWLVAGVSAGQVTVTHKGRNAAVPPPSNGVTGGAVTALKTVLSWTSATSGFLLSRDSFLDIENIGLVGGGGTSTTAGIDFYGVSATIKGRNASGRIGANVGISNFGYGWYAEGSCSVYAVGSFVSGNLFRGAHVSEGAKANIEGLTTSGNVGIGCFAGPGAYVRCSDMRSNVNSTDGMRFEAGGKTWADFSFLQGNGAHGAHVVNAGRVHFVGSRANCNGSSGIYSQNGMDGRASGAVIFCNDDTGLNHGQGSFEANQVQIVGNNIGAVCYNGDLSLQEGGISANALSGIQIQLLSRCSVTDAHFTNHNAGFAAIRAETAGRVYGANVGFAGNAGFDTQAIEATRGVVDMFTPTGLVNQSPGPRTFTLVHNFGNVPASTELTTTTTAPDLATGDIVAVSNNGAYNASLEWRAFCDTAGVVILAVYNRTAGVVAAGNRTYTFHIIPKP